MRSRYRTKRLDYILLAIAIVAFVRNSRAEDGLEKPALPGFRTDLGVQITAGGHQCFRGGTNYGACREADSGWDASWGLSGGLLTRPFRFVSAGIDISYMRMLSRRDQESNWVDFSIGPIFRVHIPFRIVKVLVEPSIGVHGGYVQGMRTIKVEGEEFYNRQVGPFISLIHGWDVFLVPGFGFGVEVRFIRTAYQESCFENGSQVVCRGVDAADALSCQNYDEATEDWEEVPYFKVDNALVDFPWKFFYGAHLIYYF